MKSIRQVDPHFDEKCRYHQERMDHYLGEDIPMLLADTKEGQAKLDVINAKVSKDMEDKFNDKNTA